MNNALLGLPTVSIIAGIAAILFAALIVSLLRLKRLKQNFQQITSSTFDAKILAAANSAFFYKSVRDNIEMGSPGLRELLDITADNITLEDLKSLFNDEEKHFSQILETIAEEHNAFSTQVTAGEKYLLCYGKRVDDRHGDIVGLLLYFNDITEIINKKNKLKARKKEIKAELKGTLDLLNASPYPIWQRDKDLNISFCNFAHLSIINEGEEKELEGEELELTRRVRELAENANAVKTAQTARIPVVVAGDRRLFKITEVPVNSATCSTVGFARDITEQEELEKELEQYVEAHSNMLESSGNAAAIYGTDMRIKFFNNAFVNLWGLDANWLENTQPTQSEVLDRLRENRKLPEQADFRGYKKEREKLFTDVIESHEEFMYLPNGQVLRVIVIPYALGGLLFSYEDMTEHVSLESKYNTAVAVKRATIDNLFEGIAAFGEDGKIQLHNPVYANMWKLDEEFLATSPHISEILERTKPLYDFGNDWDALKKEMVTHSTARNPHSQKLERLDGTVLHWNCVPLPDGATLMTYQDITDSHIVERSLRAEKEALKEADNLKSSFLNNVSYELRSPLTSIKGFSEVLLKGYFGELNDKQHDYIEGIFNSSMHLTTLINDILDIASIDAGYMTLDIKEFNIEKELAEIIPFIKSRVEVGEVTFEHECPNNIGMMLADAKRIKQVAVNLVNNSLRYTEKGNTIKLVVASKGKDDVTISVSDDGVGIPENEQEKLFERFYKKSQQRESSPQDMSNALALPVVKALLSCMVAQSISAQKKAKGFQLPVRFLAITRRC
jgi:signal transduction histidine kinase